MKAALIKQYGRNGEIDGMIEIVEDHPIPEWVSGENKLLIKVMACSIAPGDVRVLSGKTDLMQSPPSWPYIPGGDNGGIVEKADEDSRFKEGDRVIVFFGGRAPMDGMAEYRLVGEEIVEHVPDNVSMLEAAAMGSSGLSGLVAAERYVMDGNRVMIINGSGGVGAHLVQFCKLKGASYVAATSTEGDRLVELGVDRVFNHKEENWMDEKEYEDTPFDIVFDLWGGYEPWLECRQKGVLKTWHQGKGKYVTFSGDVREMEVHTYCGAFRFAFGSLLGRLLWTKLWPFVPRWIWHDGLDSGMKDGALARLMKLAEEERFKIVLDPVSPLPFSASGIEKWFHIQQDRQGKGKVVVEIASE